MTLSMELRWFQRGSVPEALRRWFTDVLDGGDELFRTEVRTDHYIAISGCEQIGIKFRSGKDLEIKVRQRLISETSIRAIAIGYRERWVKLSADSAPAEELGGSVDDPVILSVSKHRMLRKYQRSTMGIQAVSDSLSVPAGATVEITSIEIGGVNWWTLGFEAFDTTAPTDEALGATFDVIVQHVMRQYDGPRLRKQESYGYPRWLNVLSADL
jgi:hypothetical protein